MTRSSWSRLGRFSSASDPSVRPGRVAAPSVSTEAQVGKNKETLEHAEKELADAIEAAKAAREAAEAARPKKSRKEKPQLDPDGLPPGYPGLQGGMPGMSAEAATPIVSQGSSKKKGKKK